MDSTELYKPLPDCVTIKESNIHGLGLFATQDIASGTELGMSHFYWGDQLERSPLGAFYNHSDTPNCMKVRRDSRYFLETIEEVKEGDELTVEYTFYKVG